MKFTTPVRIAVVCAALSFSSAEAADTGLSASSFKVRLYKFAVSTSPLCTNLRTIIDNGSSPVETELENGGTFGSGSIDKGTYPCVVLEISDQLKYVPSTNSTSTNCVTTTAVTRGICHTGDSSLKIDGTTTTCGSGTDDRVALYISTGSSGTNGDSFVPPASIGDTTRGMELSSALVVNGAASGTMVFDTAGQVCDNNAAGCDGSAGGTGTGGAGECRLEGASISFTQ